MGQILCNYYISFEQLKRNLTTNPSKTNSRSRSDLIALNSIKNHNSNNFNSTNKPKLDFLVHKKGHINNGKKFT
jgi:hypothetical protein